MLSGWLICIMYNVHVVQDFKFPKYSVKWKSMTVLAFFIMTVSLAEDEDQFESLDDEHNEETTAETVTAEHAEQSDYNDDQHAEEHQVMNCRHYKIRYKEN